MFAKLKLTTVALFLATGLLLAGPQLALAADFLTPDFKSTKIDPQAAPTPAFQSAVGTQITPQFSAGETAAVPSSSFQSAASAQITPEMATMNEDPAAAATAGDPAAAGEDGGPAKPPAPQHTSIGLVPTSAAGLNPELCADIVDAFLIGDFQLWHVKCYAQYLINVLIFVAGGITVLFVVIGGYQYVFSGLTEDKEAGKNTIQHALMGLAVVVLAWAFVNLWQTFLTGGDSLGQQSVEAATSTKN